tara:strand:+ start:7596 stop:8003 length:408 start_codon:yes stop_codon:yes gene_type:complete
MTKSDIERKVETVGDSVVNKLPNLILTPFFENNSTWPSYHIKPVYEDTSYLNTPLTNSYYNTANNIANTIQSQSHTFNTNNNATSVMYPAMPYYIPAQKVGENTPPVVNPLVDVGRQQQLWYYQNYIPSVHNIVC